MNKNWIASVIILFVIVATIGYVYLNDNEDQYFRQRQFEITVINGRTQNIITFEDILKLEQRKFNTKTGSSANADQTNTYLGFKVKDLLDYLKIDFQYSNQLITRSVDGYVVAVSSENVLASETVYIIYETNGEPLSNREEGGDGPYRLVIKGDLFRQQWNKNISELEIR